jgi:hypothetical protein
MTTLSGYTSARIASVKNSRTDEGPEEFDCIECGRHIIRIIAELDRPKICACCMMIPGWFTVPELRAIIDPDVDPPAHERRCDVED